MAGESSQISLVASLEAIDRMSKPMTDAASAVGALDKASESADKSTEKLDAGLKKVGESSLITTESIMKLGGAMGAIMGVGAAVKFGEDSIKAYASQQKAITQLDFAMKAVGASYADSKKEINEFLAAQTKGTEFTKGDARAAMTELIRLTGSYGEQTKEATKLALDMAAATGGSATSAAHGIAMAHEGAYRALYQYLPALRAVPKATLDAMDAEERSKFLLDSLSKTYSGAATAIDDTTKAIANNKKAWEELKLEVGEFLDNSGILGLGLKTLTGGLGDMLHMLSGDPLSLVEVLAKTNPLTMVWANALDLVGINAHTAAAGIKDLAHQALEAIKPPSDVLADARAALQLKIEAEKAKIALQAALAGATTIGFAPHTFTAGAGGGAGAGGAAPKFGSEFLPGANTDDEKKWLAGIEAGNKHYLDLIDKFHAEEKAKSAQQLAADQKSMDDGLAKEKDHLANLGDLYKDRLALEQQFADDLKAIKEGAAADATDAYKSMTQGFATALSAFAQGDATFKEAIKAQAQAVVMGIAEQATVKALWEGAEALAALAMGNFAGAALHGEAAAAYAGVAVVGYAAGSAMDSAGWDGGGKSAGSGGGGSSAPAPSYQPAQAPAGQTVVVYQTIYGSLVREGEAARLASDAAARYQRSQGR